MTRSLLVTAICLAAWLAPVLAEQAAASPLGPPQPAPHHNPGHVHSHGHTHAHGQARPRFNSHWTRVPHYQQHAPDWRYSGYYPKYEGGIHVRQLQDIGFGDGSTWWRGRPW